MLKMDRYFFSKIARGMKFTVAVTAGVFAGAVAVLGFLGISTIVIPIGGCVALIPCALLLLENTKLIADLEKNISALRHQIKDFRAQLNAMKSLTDKYQVENNKFMKSNVELSDMLSEAQSKVDELDKYLIDYKLANQKFTEQLKQEKQQANVMKSQIEELMIIKSQYEAKIRELNATVAQIQGQIVSITEIKEDLETQLTGYQTTTQELSEELEKVRTMYAKSKEVIITLMKTKEIFEDVASDMVSTLSSMNITEEKTQQNVDQLNDAISRYTAQRDSDLFRRLDANGDGQLTLDEFIKGC